MTSYSGRHAELYDLFYRDKPYQHEAAFLHSQIAKWSSQPGRCLLELACGTGEHALHLQKLGYRVTATDYSADMLAQARRKALGRGLSIELALQDMRSLDLEQRSFDVVVCLFDAIGYVATNDALRDVFRSVVRHLREGGLFLFDFWHAAAMLRHAEPVRVRRWSMPDGEVLRISETAIDCPRQLARVHYSVYEHRNDGTYSTFQEEQVNRYFLIQEMAALLAISGLTPLEWTPAFNLAPITEDTWHVLAVARRDT